MSDRVLIGEDGFPVIESVEGTRRVLTPISTDDPRYQEALQRGQIFQVGREGAAAFRESQLDTSVARHVREEGGFGQLATAGRNFADTFFLGLPSAIDDELSDDGGEFNRRLRRVADEENPLSALGGSAAGVLAPALATGGATLGEAGGAAFLPGVLAQASGNTVERLLFQRLANTTLSSGVRRGLGIAAGGLVDGAIAGGLQAIESANIQGTPLDTESILANVGMGSLLGLGAGGLFGSLYAGGSTLANRARQRLVRQMERAMESGLGPEGISRENGRFVIYANTAEEAPGVIARQYAGDGPMARALRMMSGIQDSQVGDLDAVFSHPRAFDNAGYTRAARTFADQLTDDVEAGTMRSLSAAERADVRGRIVADLPAETADVLTTTIQAKAADLREAIERVAASRPNVDLSAARRLADSLSVLEGSGTPGTREFVRRGDGGFWRETPGTPNTTPLAQRLDSFLDDARQAGLFARNESGELALGQSLRAVDPEVAFAAGEILGAVRTVSDEALSTGGVHRALDRLKVAREGVGNLIEETPTGRRFRADKIFPSLSDSGYRVIDDRTPQLLEYLEAQAEVLEESAKAGLVSAEEAAQRTAAIRELVEGPMGVGALKEWGRASGAVRNLQQNEGQNAGIWASFGVGGAGLGAIAGGILGGPVGMGAGLLAGGLFSAATHPVGVGRMMSAFGSAKGATEARMTRGLSRIRSTLQGARRLRTAALGGRQVPRVVLRLDSPEKRREEYQAVTEQVRQLASNPETLMQMIEYGTGNMNRLDPSMGDYAAQRMATAVHYMAAQLPPASQPTPFDHLRETVPSAVEMDSFLRRYEALEDPLMILDWAASGMLHPDHVEAVQTVYPELLAAVQTNIVEMIGDLEKAPPYAARMQLGQLLGAPTDRSLDPTFLLSLQQQYAQTAEQQEQIRPRQTAQISNSIATDTYSETQNVTLRL